MRTQEGQHSPRFRYSLVMVYCASNQHGVSNPQEFRAEASPSHLALALSPLSLFPFSCAYRRNVPSSNLYWLRSPLPVFDRWKHLHGVYDVALRSCRASHAEKRDSREEHERWAFTPFLVGEREAKPCLGPCHDDALYPAASDQSSTAN